MLQDILYTFNFNNLNYVLAITGLLITIFSMMAVHSHIKVKHNMYYLLNILYSISFLIVIFSKDWLVFFVAWELVTIITSLMLLWKSKGLAAQYFIIQFIGSSLLLFVILLAINNGYTEIMPIKETWLQNLFILGVGMKSAIFGFHFWLPSIYLQAPVTFNAISSGWVAKLGFITMLKLIPQGNQLLLVLALLMIFYGGVKALKVSNLKLLLTYSSISQLGYIALGIASGTLYGYIGSVLHIVAHGLAKTGLFLACGNFIKEYSSQCIYDFKNAWYRQKLSSLSMVISFASLMGIPLLAGFNSKYLIKYGYQNEFLFTIIMYTASLLTAFYSLRFIYLAIIKDLINNRSNSREQKYNLRIAEYLALVIMSTLLIIVGFNAELIELIISIVEKTKFEYNFIKGILEVVIYILVSLIILKQLNWYKNIKEKSPTLDPIFASINKWLYNVGRFLYRIINLDFQFQLLWIPIFLLILFLLV
ncbi:MAG: complex I subunit 5 family protein [Halothermotrichaceae bacterium]